MQQKAETLFRKLGREFGPGEQIFAEGDPAGEIYVVHRGLVRESRWLAGVQKALREIGPSGYFGENALIQGRTRLTSAWTLEPSLIITIQGSQFLELIKNKQEIGVRIIRALVQQIDLLQADVGSLLQRDLRVRLATHLLALDAKLPLPELVALTGRLGLRSGEIEELVHSFSQAGLVQREGSRLVAIDRPGLQEYLQYLRLAERFSALS